MDDLKLIKKHYGEQMSHLCRELFPTLLETPGLLYTILSSTYAHSKFLYNDIVENNYIDIFKNLIYDRANLKKENEAKKKLTKTPQELMDEAGYILYECHSEEDIQKFKKYYAKGEELCTFKGDRLNRCHVFFAVKKNVDDIKREDYINKESRQDEYGTSVISIQFSKGIKNTLSIKNRYNHTVLNPDATFSNNLENIIPGLTEAFEKEYSININAVETREDLNGYVRAGDGKYYKYNQEIDNIYYCPNNIIIDGFEVKQYDPSRYIVLDDFVLDMQQKTIEKYDAYYCDSFLDGLQDIKSIEIINNKKDKTKDIIINKDIVITIDEFNRIIRYKNHHITQIDDAFLYNNEELKELDIPNVRIIRNDFLASNYAMEKISIPNVISIGEDFLSTNKNIKHINLPKVKEIGSSFCESAEYINEISLPEIESVCFCFLSNAKNLKKVYFPKLKEIGGNFLSDNEMLEEIDLPECEEIDSEFMSNNFILSKINLPKVKTIGTYFLGRNENLKEINLPKLEQVENEFLYHNSVLNKISVPKLKKIGNNFLFNNEELKTINLPRVEVINNAFLHCNEGLLKITAPNLRSIGFDFLYANRSLKSLILPKLQKIGYNYLGKNMSLLNNDLSIDLNRVFLPSLISVEESCSYFSEEIELIAEKNITIIAPNLSKEEEKPKIKLKSNKQ